MKERVLQALGRLGRAYDRLLELKGDRRLYITGGALRDVAMGRQPADFDLAVSGSGIEFAAAFARRVRGRLVLLSEPDDEARVVYRRSVTFDFNGFGDRPVEQELRRRDFTINALACEVLTDGIGDVIDLFGCRRDIEAQLVRPVSDDSLAADPLRLLRAIRIGLELGFTLDPEVFEQARGASLAGIAGERIGVELLRILEQPGACGYIERLHSLGRLADVLPGLAPVLADSELCRHTLKTCLKIEEVVHGPSFFSQFEPEWRVYFDCWRGSDESEGESAAGLPYRRALLKLAGLLHDIAKPETRFQTSEGEMHFYGHDSLGARNAGRMVRERLRLSRPQVKMVRTLVQEHMRLHLLATGPDLSERAIRRYFRDLGQEAFGLMILCVADGWATAGRTGHLEETITRMLNQKRAEGAQVKVDRLVTGYDLIALGMKPGPAFKVILQELEELQIEGRITTKEEGLAYLKTHLSHMASP
jgi:poly(A) polymerase